MLVLPWARREQILPLKPLTLPLCAKTGLVPEVIRIARRTMSIVKMNLAFTALYNVVGITLAAFGILPPVLAAARTIFTRYRHSHKFRTIIATEEIINSIKLNLRDLL